MKVKIRTIEKVNKTTGSVVGHITGEYELTLRKMVWLGDGEDAYHNAMTLELKPTTGNEDVYLQITLFPDDVEVEQQ